LGEDREYRENAPKLEWRDFVAIAIATLETTLLPIVVVVVLLLVAVLLLR
jgi:hypothetical protein